MKKLFIPVRTSLCLLLIFFWFQACSHSNENSLNSHSSENSLKTISPKMASDLIIKHKNNSDFIILDVRTSLEFKSGHIEKAILLNYYSETFTDELKRLDKSKIYLIYCRSGNRSGKTLDMVKKMGFSRVYNMDQGIKGWRSKDFPVVN